MYNLINNSDVKTIGLIQDPSGTLCKAGEAHITYRITDKLQFWESYCQSTAGLRSASKLLLAEKLAEGEAASLVFYTDEDPRDVATSIINAVHESTDLSDQVDVAIVLKNTRYDPDDPDDYRYRIHFPMFRCRQNLMKKVELELEGTAIAAGDVTTLYGSTHFTFHSVDDRRDGYLHSGGQKEMMDAIPKLFSLSLHSDLEGIATSALLDSDLKLILLPLLLSRRYGGKIVNVTQTDESSIDYHNDKIQFFETFLNMIPKNYMCSFPMWCKIGEAMKNVYGYDEGRQAFSNLTRQLEEIYVDPDNYYSAYHPHLSDDNTYDIFYYTGPSIDVETFAHNIMVLYDGFKSYCDTRTVAWYASVLSTAAYNQYHDRWCNYLYTNALNSGTTRDWALLFWARYWLIFTCTSNKNKPWWYYNVLRHRWMITDDATELKRRLNTDFIEYLKSRGQHLKHSVRALGSDNESKQKTKGMSDINEHMMSALGEPAMKRKLLEEASTHFKDEFFFDKLNCNFNYSCFSNCVMETVTYKLYSEPDIDIGSDHYGYVVVRPGMPSDYRSRGSQMHYDMSLNIHSPTTQLSSKWLRQIYTDKDVREYVEKFLASTLRGGNDDKLVHTFIGRGNNSKTMLFLALKEIYGEDFVIIPASSFMRGAAQSSGNATTDINRAIHAKIAAISELAPNDFLDVKKVKGWSGKDPQHYRHMYEESREGIPQSKLIIGTNSMPSFLGGVDRALIERVVAIPHNSKWTNNAPKTDNEQFITRTFKLDPRFQEQLPLMAKGILCIMVNTYPRYVAEGLSVRPEAIVGMTRRYWFDTDIFQQFIAMNLEAVVTDEGISDLSSSVSVYELYQRFIEFYSHRKPSAKIPSIFVMKDEVEKRISISYSDYWYGVKLTDLTSTAAGEEDRGEIKPAILDGTRADYVLEQTSRLYED